LVEGVTLQNPPEPERLILDGQQRLTSLFQSLFSGQPVVTRDPREKVIFYTKQGFGKTKNGLPKVGKPFDEERGKRPSVVVIY
jgi:hypothetical protein